MPVDVPKTAAERRRLAAALPPLGEADARAISAFIEAAWAEHGLARHTQDAYRRDLEQLARWRNGAAPTAGNWGCESTVGTPPTKYVSSITTDDNGVITVTANNFDDPTINGKSITLTPYVSEDTAMTTATDMGKPVYKWVCGPSATGIPAKFLPGSCRGAAAAAP